MPRVCAFAAAVCAFAVVLAPAARADGSFASSDDLVDLIWQSSVRTAGDMVSPTVNLDPRGCEIELPEVLLDGTDRDRCPWVGDEAVLDVTLLVSRGDMPVMPAMLEWFASAQRPDGSIPSSPFRGKVADLIDYNAYWVEALYQYTLYSGNLAPLKRVYPNLQRLIDGLYPRHVGSDGLLVNWLGADDYAFIPRQGTRVSYYKAQYARALREAAALAGWLNDARSATAWRARAQQLADRFPSAFWDPSVGAFQDTTDDDAVHPQDGNAFAILAGLASPQQARSALDYLDRTTAGSNGNAIADTDGWRGPNWGAGDNERIYPFIGYFDVLARYAAGADDSALDLLRREWGSMATRQPGTMWEMVDYETEGRDTVVPSVDHGWSSGAAAAITSYVLGVQPTAPGFSTFTVAPHPGDLSWAQGSVPTPHGPIRVSWRKAAGGLALSVTAPRGTRWVRPAAGRR